MKVTPGSTDVSAYFNLETTAGAPATGLTITDLDLQYVRSGEAPVAKVDATALAATDSAHSDNTGIEIDATDQPGLHRFDWPDAAFAANVPRVFLTVKGAAIKPAHLMVELETLQTGDSYAIVNSGTHGNAALKTLIDTIDDFLDTEMAAVVGYIDTEVAAIKAVTDLLIAAHAEPTGVPAANATPLNKIGFLFAALRNKVTVTSSKMIFYDDADAALWEKDLSDNGTTYTETEGNAP